MLSATCATVIGIVGGLLVHSITGIGGGGLHRDLMVPVIPSAVPLGEAKKGKSSVIQLGS